MISLMLTASFVLESQSFGRIDSFGQDENQDHLTSVLTRELRSELEHIS